MSAIGSRSRRSDGMEILNECYNFQGSQGMDQQPSNLTFRLQSGDSEVRYWNRKGVGRIVLRVHPTADGSLTALAKGLGGRHPITGHSLQETTYHIALVTVDAAVAAHFGRAVEGSNARYASLRVEEVTVDEIVREYRIMAIDDRDLPEPLTIIPRIQMVLGQAYPSFGLLTVDARKDVDRIVNGQDGNGYFFGTHARVPADPYHISLLNKEEMDAFKLGEGQLTISQMTALIEPLKNATILALPGRIMKLGKKGIGMVVCSEQEALNANADFAPAGTPPKQRTTFAKRLKAMGCDTPASRTALVQEMGRLALDEMRKRIAATQEKAAALAAEKAEREANEAARAQAEANMTPEEQERAYRDHLDEVVAQAKARVIDQANKARSRAIVEAKKAFPKGDKIALGAINEAVRAVVVIAKV